MGRHRSLLVSKAFKAYTAETVKAAFGKENTNLAVIPGGLTSVQLFEEIIAKL